MELIVFGAIALGVVYVLYKVYGPKDEAPAVTVSEVVAKAEEVVAPSSLALLIQISALDSACSGFSFF